jgi:C-terminal processing protease CtpA/Prc
MFDLSARGMKSLVIDLRRNPGGLLESAVELADNFLVRGGIVSTRGRNTAENRNYTAHAAGTWDIPLVVLIDGDSASASEIFAGAIRDHDRGYIVGQISYGKGSVQGVFPSDRGIGGLRLTVSRFYSPSGTAISQRGITPHVLVPEDPPASPSTLVALKPPVGGSAAQGNSTLGNSTLGDSTLGDSTLGDSTLGGTETGTNLTAQRPVLQPAIDPAQQGKADRVLDKGLEIARQIATGSGR